MSTSSGSVTGAPATGTASGSAAAGGNSNVDIMTVPVPIPQATASTAFLSTNVQPPSKRATRGAKRRREAEAASASVAAAESEEQNNAVLAADAAAAPVAAGATEEGGMSGLLKAAGVAADGSETGAVAAVTSPSAGVAGVTLGANGAVIYKPRTATTAIVNEADDKTDDDNTTDGSQDERKVHIIPTVGGPVTPAIVSDDHEEDGSEYVRTYNHAELAALQEQVPQHMRAREKFWNTDEGKRLRLTPSFPHFTRITNRGDATRTKQGRCEVCLLRSSAQCSACKVYLCFHERPNVPLCTEEFHTRKTLERPEEQVTRIRAPKNTSAHAQAQLAAAAQQAATPNGVTAAVVSAATTQRV